ncbi:unnamed protein product [Auanema sp. JU1783]|nr:unnamed protein product [Auanema sp. JU1783]
MGAEAKLYLQEHSIPQLFEGLMTGLIYNRPEDPLGFLEDAIRQLKENPDNHLSWDMFIDKGITSSERREIASKRTIRSHNGPTIKDNILNEDKKKKVKEKEKESSVDQENKTMREHSRDARRTTTGSRALHRQPSVIKASEVAQIPDVPIILFMGGPGGGKTRHAARVSDALSERGLVHICMPDVIRKALTRYKDKYAEWKGANDHYMRGELIPNHLALALVKAEMGRHKNATAFFLEGFPREARQVEDFERQVKTVNMALIIDYDEKTLRDHMERRGLGMELIDQKIKEFKQKTLPSAKYFDDQKLLHLIPGEKDDQAIFERMKSLVEKAMESGIPVYNSNPPSQNGAPASKPESRAETSQSRNEEISAAAITATAVEAAAEMVATSQSPIINEVPPVVSPDVEKDTSQPKEASRKSTAAGRPPTNPSRPGSRKSRKSTASSNARIVESKAEEFISPDVPEVVVVPTSASPSVRPTTKAGSRPSTGAAPPLETVLSSVDINDEIVGDSTVRTGLPNNAPVVLIVGAPGSNKAEIAKRIVQKYDGFILLSMGELLRRKAAEMREDDIWKRVNTKMEQGEPVPMILCRDVLFTEMHNIGQTSWGYVIEGYPRTLSQVTDLENIIERIDVVILVDCTEQYCEEVVKKRYELNKVDRPDDTPEVFKIRLASFKQNTLPMLKYLDDKGKLRVVDGDQDIDSVFKDVCQTIDSTLFIEGDDGEGHSLDESKKGSLN